MENLSGNIGDILKEKSIGILLFDRSDPYMDSNFKCAVNASKLVTAIWDIDQYLREQKKWNTGLTKSAYSELEKAHTKFYEILNENGINLDELMM